MTTNYGIQYQPLSQTISTGRLNKSRSLFLDKQDVTDHALMAAIQYVQNVYDGAMITESSDGKTWHVQVTDITNQGDDDA